MKASVTKAKSYILDEKCQIGSAVVMIRPTDFRYNEQTATDNEFMELSPLAADDVTELALQEFETCVKSLRQQGVLVLSFDKENYPQLADIDLPDAVFPDHFTTWANGDITAYPMKNQSRDQEKNLLPLLFKLMSDAGFVINKVTEIEREDDASALEAKGSLILDRKNKRVYASVSQRTSEQMILKWAKEFGFDPIIFRSYSPIKGKEIYHTDLILSIGEQFVVICDEVIEEKSRRFVLEKLSEDREVIRVSAKQALGGFVCNCAEIKAVCSTDQHHVLIMSRNGVNLLTLEQKIALGKYVTIVPFPIKIIERVGGGSARCMIAEIFNPYKGQQ